MYKIYINGTPLFLTATEEFRHLKLQGDNFIKTRYVGKKKFLHNYIDLLEKQNSFDAVVIHHHDVEKLWADFRAIYKVIKAAGGIVENNRGEILMIFRRGYWDLPKGKVEKNETLEEAAVREVQEETGLQSIDLQLFIHVTYHTYTDRKARRILKESYWYTMKTTDIRLIPQAEEDIEEAIFVDLKSFISTPKNIYGNILDVVSAYQTKKNN
ncbi:MAG: NUDIX domain-containing protein [Bacteroidota bacterium]